jgi:diguanylate cyclase (GGDEF)-like protein/PAS domain S-box-containing protein
MQASGAEVDLLEGEELICHGAAGTTTRGVGFRTNLDGLSGLSVITGKGQVSMDTEGDIRVNQAICRQLGVRCVAVAPMTLGDRVVGVIRVTYDRPNVFSDREMSILLMLCAAMGGVIERRRIGDALRKSEERYRLLFERNPHAMYVYDPRTLKFLAVNDSAVQRYGYTAQEFRGMVVSDLWPREGNVTVAETTLRSIPLFAKTADLRRRHVRKDGSLMDVELSADGIVYDGKPARLVLIVDVSERVNAEREVVRMARAQQMLSACNESLIRASDRQALLDKVCQIAVDIGGYRAAWVAFARDDADKTVEPVAFAGIGSEAIRDFPMSWAEHLPAGQGTVGRAIRSQSIVAAHDISLEPPSKMWADVLRVFDVRGVISLPLRDRERAFGVLGLYSTEPVYPGSDELVLMEELANDLAFGITHLGAREEQRKLQEAVLRVAAAVTNQVGARFFDDLVRNLAEAVEASAGLIAHLAPGAISARAVSTFAAGGATEPFEFVLAESPFESVLREEMLFVRSGLKNRYAGRFARYDGFAGCRLNDSNGNPIGLLAVFFDGPPQSAGFVENALKIFAARAASELERQQFDAQLHRAAFYDALTELPNRRLFLSRLQEVIDAPAARAQCGAVLFLNLDNFAIVNKTLGHTNADRLLQQVSERLGLRLRGSGLLARLGGDEFLVLLSDLGHEPVSVKRKASLVAQSLLEALSLPFGLGGYEQTISACVGIVTFGHGDTVSPDELLQRVDLALAGAKAGGRNSIRFFDPVLQQAVAERAALEAELGLALAEGQLELHYQPQVARDGRILGVEALIRWRHPKRGMISPANFIPLAEETGLIVSIGQWVIESACKLLNSWSRRPQTASLTVSVNVSAAQFQQRSFVSQVGTAVTAAAANPRLLKLELTESVLVQDMEAVIEKMHALRALGVGFSMDDFGTGYSSLSYLKRMPLDQLKIDQSFVRDLLTDVNDATIAKTIIALAHNLGLMVIAEGVEQLEQRDLLFSHDCDAFQGYLFSRPVPLAELETLLD